MSGEDSHSHTGLEIGRTLQRAREKRGLSLQQVEEATKIRTRYLRDLENDNFDMLPAVYVLGSLRTYAWHLGLDGAAMTRELKRRQASPQAEKEDEAREEPPPGGPRGLLASLARLVGIGERVEDEAGAMSGPIYSPRLYVGFAMVLIIFLATALASNLGGEAKPSVSQVREPKISQSPSMLALVGNKLVDKPYAEGGDIGNQSDKQAKVPASDAGEGKAEEDAGIVEVEESGHVEGAPRTSQAPPPATVPTIVSASTPASTPASAPSSASAAPTESVPAPVAARPARESTKPEPAAKEDVASAGEESEAAVTPTAPPARMAGSTRVHQTQRNTIDPTRLGNRIPDKVEKAVDSVW
jgi:transcriptional regulator with XRE-family HTH domain